MRRCSSSEKIFLPRMRLLLFLYILLYSPALARYYEITLEKYDGSSDAEFLGVPATNEFYYLDVSVPWGLIGATLTFDPAYPETITISARTWGIAQGYRFYAVDSLDSEERQQIASNHGDHDLSAFFTMSSGSAQFLTFSSDIEGEEGWVHISYDKDSGLSIVSQNEVTPPRAPIMTFTNGRVVIEDSDFSLISVIQQSSDLKNWTTIGEPGNYVSIPLSELPGPVFFRVICP